MHLVTLYSKVIGMYALSNATGYRTIAISHNHMSFKCDLISMQSTKWTRKKLETRMICKFQL